MGSLGVRLPLTSSCCIVSNIALCGIPFLAGFYSKDLILETCLLREVNLLALIILFLSTGLTVSYTVRVVYHVFLKGAFTGSIRNLSEGSGDISSSYTGLAVLSVIGGAGMSWLLIDVRVVCLPAYLKWLTLRVCLLGVYLGIRIRTLKTK